MQKYVFYLALTIVASLTGTSHLNAQGIQPNQSASLTAVDRINAFWPEARPDKKNIVIRGQEKLIRYDRTTKESKDIASFDDPIRIGISWWLSGSGAVAIEFGKESKQLEVIDTEQGTILRRISDSEVESPYLKGLMLHSDDLNRAAWEHLNFEGDALYIIALRGDKWLSRVSWQANKPVETIYGDQEHLPSFLSHALLSSEGEDFVSVCGKEGPRKSFATLFDSRFQFKGSLELPNSDKRTSWGCHGLRVYKHGDKEKWEALAFYSNQLRWVVAHFTPNGSRIVYQGELPHQGNPVAQFTACCFSKDQTWMAVSANDRVSTLAVTNLRDGTTLASQVTEKPVLRLVCDSDDSQFISSSVDEVIVWKLNRENDSLGNSANPSNFRSRQ